MKKIIALTGSFNPVTKAHFGIMSDAVKKYEADEGVFIATNDKYLTKKRLIKMKPPSSFMLSEETRTEMLSSLSVENSKLSFWGFELGGANPNTYKTLVSLVKSKQKQYPNEEIKLYFLFGADKLKEVSHWQNAEAMSDLCDYLVYARKFDINQVIDADPFLSARRDRIHLLNVEDEDIEDVSSTFVRRAFFARTDYSSLMNEGPYNILKRFSPSDFKPVSPEDVIRAQYEYGGRFGANAARILVYKRNKELFNSWDSSWLGDKEEHSTAKVYRNAFTVFTSELMTPTETDCMNADCADVAESLIKEGLKPAILNLASNVSPCGGYHNGANAQEECIARMSTLSRSLYCFGDVKRKHIREAGLPNTTGVYPLDLNFGGIYSPCVTFFRYGEEKYYDFREDTFDCPVITVASLSNREKNDYSEEESNYFSADGYLNAEGKEIETNKIRTIFRIALDNGHDSIVLGAFGCGVYNLRSDEVSQLFKDVLNEPEFNNKFKKLVFAIYEGKPSPRKAPMGKDGKFAPFYNIFKTKKDNNYGK